MNKPELQNLILDNTQSLSKLAWAIDRLPECETKGEFLDRFNQTVQKLVDLHDNLRSIDKDACYFGLTDKCSGCHCTECWYWIEAKDGR